MADLLSKLKQVPLLQSVRALPRDLRAAQKPTVFVAGLPRSGTTWLASTLSAAQGVRYLHEPFNVACVPAAEPFHMQYVRATDTVPDFARYSREAFSGRGENNGARTDHALQQYSWWPSRTLIKDVHVCLALDWIDAHLRPQIVIALRHPCAMIASWSRLREQIPDDWHWQEADVHLQRLLTQPTLMDDHLAPYRDVLESAETYFEKLGAFWGASNYVMLQQAKQHPAWLVVQHDVLCVEPEREYRALFGKLGLSWTDTVQRRINRETTNTSKMSARPYTTKRVASDQPHKWKSELSEDEAEQVLRFARPFDLPIDLAFDLG